MFTNFNELKQDCNKEWAEIPPQQETNSYRKRLLQVIASKLWELWGVLNSSQDCSPVKIASSTTIACFFKCNICIFTLFSWFGMMHLTKLGCVLCSVVMSFAKDSLYSCPTVRNIPFLVFEALGMEVSVILANVSRPTTLSAERHKTMLTISLCCYNVSLNCKKLCVHLMWENAGETCHFKLICFIVSRLDL